MRARATSSTSNGRGAAAAAPAARPGKRRRFKTGGLHVTTGALEDLEALRISPLALFERHVTGDWGALPAQDCLQNNRAALSGGRVCSAYDLGRYAGRNVRLWLITEGRGQLRLTTILRGQEF